uniref:PR domain containing 14 n=1 Tax=Electrophorus electricus TaxID=8005 RepID=A0AAY5EB77_ELEEL
MSVSLSSNPTAGDRSFHLDPLKGVPSGVSGYCPLPGAHYMNILRSAHSTFHPLKSLGRLVSDTQAIMPFNFSGSPSFFRQHHHQASGLHDQVFGVSNLPYFSRIQPPPASCPKHEGLPQVLPEQLTGFLPEFSSPFSDKSSSTSSSPAKDSCVYLPCTETIKEHARTYNFTEEDLFTVLYGYSKKQERDVGHAISGLTFPCNSGILIMYKDAKLVFVFSGLLIHQITCGNVSHCGVFADKSTIPKGTRFGPFRGKLVNTSEIKTYDDNTLMWEIFENGRLSHFVDGKGASGNWMSLVKCARFPEEQNLIAVQCEGQIYYETCKEVRPSQELLVWYGDCYVQFLGIPLTLKEFFHDNEPMPSEANIRSVYIFVIVRVLIDGDSGEGYKCDRCGKVFAYKYYRDKHLKYTRCAFTASSILRTHIRQHSGERPFKCKHCGKAFASHAAHDSHVRRTHAKDKPFCCDVCGCTFQEAEELKVHIKSHKSKTAV